MDKAQKLKLIKPLPIILEQVISLLKEAPFNDPDQRIIPV